jgi:hypothetical protein
MRVTDPCYERGTWCAGVLDNVKNGVWESYAYIENYGRNLLGGERVKALAVKHKGTNIDWGFKEQVADFEVGVDSGQAGFFNESLYPDGEPGEYGDMHTFYGRACAQTHDETNRHQHAGTIKEGVVSSSGWGDGGYSCTYVKDNDGQVVAARIDFITDEEDEDGNEDEPQCVSCGVHDDLDGESLCADCAAAADELEDE